MPTDESAVHPERDGATASDGEPDTGVGLKDRLIGAVDDFQQRRPYAAVPLAVWKKFSEDEAGKMASLISYFAFLSIFPLLIVFTTILSHVLAGNPELAQQIVTTAAGSFLSIGAGGGVQPLNVAGFALVIGVLVALWSGLAVVNQMQDSMNTVYEVPKTERPGFAPRILRSLTLLVIIGVGLPLTTVFQGLASQLVAGFLATADGWLLAVGLNTGLIATAFRRATVAETTWRQVLPGAAIAAVAWSIMQVLATALLTQRVEGAQASYGSFAIVVALLFWFFLLAQITLYCAELNVVLAHRLWPRGLRGVVASEAHTDADLRANTSYPKREQQVTNITVAVDRTTPDEREPEEAAPARDG